MAKLPWCWFLASAVAACSGGEGESAGQGPVAPRGVELAGTLTLVESSVADGDVNDPNAAYAPNDEPGDQQVVASPATVGGYANQPGAGPQGPARERGDTADSFLVPLAGGQHVNLYVAQPAAGDLDLFLLDESLVLLDSSEGVTHDETVTAPRDGTYTVVVYAYGGATNYQLQLGAPQATASHALRYRADFVPGEVTAAFVEPKARSTLGDSVAERARALGLEARGGAPGRPMLFALPSAGIPDALAVPNTAAAGWQRHLQEFDAKRMTLRAIKALAARADVASAEPNLVRRRLATANDPHFAQQWHYDLMNLPLAWDVTRGIADVLVAVIDSGVVLRHPDLAGQFDPQDPDGFDFISDAAAARDGDGRDASADDPGDATQRGDSSFHGTHVAGTVAAATDNRTGVAGAAGGVRIMPLRVLGVGGGTSYDIQQAVLYAAGLPNDSGRVPPRRADVINLSLGGADPSWAEEQVYARVANAGVLIAAAAGNDGAAELNYPASYPSVVSVASVVPSGARAAYSQFNAAVDVAAPGGGSGYGVLSTHATDASGFVASTYAFMQGTSMAAPHVAGVMALMRSLHPALTQRQFLDLLAAGRLTRDLGTPGYDTSYGWGLLDGARAVDAALALAGTPPPPPRPILASSLAELDFGTSITTLFFNVYNADGGALVVDAVASDQPWLTVGPDAVEPDGTGRYRASVARVGLGAGEHAATVRAQSSAGTLEIPVRLQAGADLPGGSGGYTYVLLLDPGTGATVAQAAGAPEGGALRYSFEAVPPGTYELVAGTDQDNDGYVCDAGEACGAFRALAAREALTIGAEDRAVADFNAGFQFGPMPAGTDGWWRLR